MPENQDSLNFNQKVNVLQPRPEDAYPISVSEWNRLMSRVKQSENFWAWYLSAAFFFFGIAATAFLSALGLPPKTESYIVIVYWAVCITTLLTGISTLFYAWLHRRDRTRMRENLLDDMKALGDRF